MGPTNSIVDLKLFCMKMCKDVCSGGITLRLAGVVAPTIGLKNIYIYKKNS
jgi:hypothetical protein